MNQTLCSSLLITNSAALGIVRYSKNHLRTLLRKWFSHFYNIFMIFFVIKIFFMIKNWCCPNRLITFFWESYVQEKLFFVAKPDGSMSLEADNRKIIDNTRLEDDPLTKFTFQMMIVCNEKQIRIKVFTSQHSFATPDRCRHFINRH